MGFLGDRWAIGDTLYFEAQTQGSSGPVDADSAPTYRVYEQGVTAPLLTGSMSLLDSTNTDGFYSANIALTAANGFERGKSYYIRKYGVVSTQPGAKVDTFRITGAGVTSFSAVAGWPTLADVQTRLEEMGLTAPRDDTIEGMIAAAVGRWERVTRFSPFLNAAETETARYYRPVYSVTEEVYFVFFDNGVFDTPSEVLSGGYYGSDGAYTGGTTLVVNRDYQMLPDNAAAEGKPYTYMQIHNTVLNSHSKSVKVTAPFGYGAEVPTLAWEAVMQEILFGLFPQQMISKSGGAQRKKLGDAEVDYGSGGGIFTRAGELMSAFARQTAAQFRRSEGGFA